MKTFELEIVETGRENLKVQAESFNKIKESFSSIEELKQYLIERYGKIPKGKRKVYTGTDNKVIGFLYSFWNQDISHNSHKWYQTDWITFWEQETTRRFFKLADEDSMPLQEVCTPSSF